MIAILTQDLMMSSSAAAAARANSMTLKTFPMVAKAAEFLLENRTGLLLVDLQMPGLNLEELTSKLAQLPEPFRPRTVAYAQHVNVELLHQGQQAGFDDVVTRGQLSRGLGELFSRVGPAAD